MSRSFLLQDWTTMRSSVNNASFVQDPSDWLDLNGFSDVVCWLDVLEVTPPGGLSRNFLKLQFETAPSFEDAYFLPIAPPTSVGTQAPYVQPSATPTIVRSAKSTVSNNLMRFLRWNITPSTTGAWDITFRIRAIAARSTTFVPSLLPGCVAWYRGDLGITPNAGTTSVLAWADQSGTNDANKNLATGVSPTLNVSDGLYMGQTTLSFARASGQYLKSGVWATTLMQPSTWLVVGHTASIGAVATDANDAGGGQSTFVDGGSNSVISSAAHSLLYGNAWSSASALLGEFNGTSSALYFNDFTTPRTTGDAGSASHKSLTVGSFNASAGGPGNLWDGTIAEIVAYAGILSPTSKAQLRQYVRGRYGITVG